MKAASYSPALWKWRQKCPVADHHSKYDGARKVWRLDAANAVLGIKAQSNGQTRWKIACGACGDMDSVTISDDFAEHLEHRYGMQQKFALEAGEYLEPGDGVHYDFFDPDPVEIDYEPFRAGWAKPSYQPHSEFPIQDQVALRREISRKVAEFAELVSCKPREVYWRLNQQVGESTVNEASRESLLERLGLLTELIADAQRVQSR